MENISFLYSDWIEDGENFFLLNELLEYHVCGEQYIAKVEIENCVLGDKCSWNENSGRMSGWRKFLSSVTQTVLKCWNVKFVKRKSRMKPKIYLKRKTIVTFWRKRMSGKIGQIFLKFKWIVYKTTDCENWGKALKEKNVRQNRGNILKI